MNTEIARPTLAGRQAMAQVFLLSLTLMLFEINLVRLYSIVIRNLGFFVLAVSLFGIGLGGLYAQIQKKPSKPAWWMFSLPLAGGVAMVLALLVLCHVPLRTTGEIAGHYSAARLAVLFLTAALPFFFGSVYISRIFAARPASANGLYFGDLVGASLGSLLAIALLQVAGGVSMPFLVAAMSVLVGGLAAESLAKKLIVCALAAIFILAGILNQSENLVNVHPDGIKREAAPLYSKWDFSSRIEVMDAPNWIGWRPSANYTGPKPSYLTITQDGHAPAFIARFDGDLATTEHLRWDITSMPYEVLSPKKVLVIGAGGGRDILTAKAYGVPNIDGVELNAITANEVMRERFAEESGNVYNLDGVRIFQDNGRTFVGRTQESYDLIYTSLADTLLGKAEGAFILSENHLYTTEAFKSYLDHLSLNGVACILYSALREGQLLARFVASASDALKMSGIDHPEEHLIAVMTPDPPGGVAEGVCLMFSKAKVSDEMVTRAQSACARLGYTLAWPEVGPDSAWRRTIATVLPERDRADYQEASFYDQSAFHDDRPYIFYCVKPKDFFSTLLIPLSSGDRQEISLAGLPMLIDLFLIVFICVMVLMVSPLLIFERRALVEMGRGQLVYLLVFFLLGVGYMMVEVSLLQQLFLFLGDPTLTFAVTLGIMLAFTGLGSLLSQRISQADLARALGPMAVCVCIVLAICALGIKPLLDSFQSAGLAARLALLVPVLALMAIPMGTLMPSCIRLIGVGNRNITCWAWGMNGVGSVLGTVLASLIALNLGISRVGWIGLGCYGVVATIALLSRSTAGANAEISNAHLTLPESA